MSLYNMLFGVNQLAPVLLAALGLSRDQVPRFRDCYVDGEKKQIVIHTRTGGGNREDYQDENDELCAHPQYLHDEDDDFDSTYADFYFSFPPDLAADLTALCDKVETHRPSERWQELFAALKAKGDERKDSSA